MNMIFHGLNFLLAQSSPPTALAPNPIGAQIKMLAPLFIVMVIMWVLMIAPQRKKQKELENTLKTLRAGDRIVSTSGIIGVVLSVKDRSISVRSADTKLELLKSSVAEVTERGGGETSEAKT